MSRGQWELYPSNKKYLAKQVCGAIFERGTDSVECICVNIPAVNGRCRNHVSAKVCTLDNESASKMEKSGLSQFKGKLRFYAGVWHVLTKKCMTCNHPALEGQEVCKTHMPKDLEDDSTKTKRTDQVPKNDKKRERVDTGAVREGTPIISTPKSPFEDFDALPPIKQASQKNSRQNSEDILPKKNLTQEDIAKLTESFRVIVKEEIATALNPINTLLTQVWAPYSHETKTAGTGTSMLHNQSRAISSLSDRVRDVQELLKGTDDDVRKIRRIVTEKEDRTPQVQQFGDMSQLIRTLQYAKTGSYPPK